MSKTASGRWRIRPDIGKRLPEFCVDSLLYACHHKQLQQIYFRRVRMSQHRSLRSNSKTAVKRNVLKRFERVDLLRARGKWKEGDRGLGLPKTKSE
jgi:small basic protein (TIGR04137 family)